ncbi:CD63 antigen-like isoform X1 [Melanotaenia boesemani]|uniref:CD63 antigen-like isoform X1 n=1 Tax=Melanotaenia boesemani TaxID=1250792 RepID=UPI001C03E4B6|nr:CD63 antigen-like isoform X1 [Melanotaenia boesemani]
MARINGFLKCIFISFNIFFAIVGGVIIGLAALSQAVIGAQVENQLEGQASGLILLYVIGIVTMVIALVGACGAHKESKACLIVFLVCMVIGSLMMFRAGIPVAIARPQVEGVLEARFRQFLPLDKAESNVKQIADAVQTQMHCCGLFSYKDWENDIPDSCECTEVVEKYECQNINYRDFYQMKTKSIYSEPCFPIILHYVLMVVDIGLGVFFFLAALAVLGMILSSIMIHQLRHPERPTVLFTVPTIFTSGPPKYQELHNPPPPY